MFNAAPHNEQVGYVTRLGVDEPLEPYGEYYTNYPAIIDSIRQTAAAHGFHGQYWGSDLSWAVTERESGEEDFWGWGYTETQVAKYFARAIAMHLGKDAGADPIVLKGTREYSMVADLNAILAGTVPIDLGVRIESEATDIVSYGFTHLNGDKSLALWTNGAAVDDDPGVNTTLTFTGLSADRVTGIDVVQGFEQGLTAETSDGSLVIGDLQVKDYPIILRMASPTLTGILAEGLESPAAYELGDNYPNPFNPTTSIAFQIPARSGVSIKIYNLLGQEIRDLVQKDLNAGLHRIEWSGLDNEGRVAATGMYLIQMKSGDFVETKRCLLLR